MERRSTFAATTAGKSFCPRPPVPSPRESRAAVVGDIRAYESGDRSRKSICEPAVRRNRKNKPTKERHSYENENYGHQRNHRGDTFKMDATGADDAGDPRHDARRDRLPQSSPLSRP